MIKEVKKEKISYPKILFYGGNPYVFRSTPIGHLYEICQVYPTILLSEKLDPETEEVLANKKLFPKLEEITPVQQFTGRKMGLLAKNRYLYKLAKDITQRYKPDIVITDNDMCPFELYLLRFIKSINALKISIQPSYIGESTTTAKWVDLINAHQRFPSILPFWLRFFLVKCRKYLGHFLYYWILPLSVGEKPFFGKSSYILRKGNSGMRDADYQIVFSKRDYEIYLKDGVPAEKLYILSHPLQRETREFFRKVFLDLAKKNKKNRNIATLLLPEEELGFRRKDCSLISKEEIQESRIKITSLVTQILNDWNIFIKPHPDIKNVEEITRLFEAVSNRIKVLDPQEPIDKYIEMSDLIIGLPRAASTALFTSFLQCPEKPVIALDLHHELLGNVYKDFEGIEYIDNEQKFIEVLKSIQNSTYYRSFNQTKKQLEAKEFSNSIEMIEFLFNKKKNETY